MSWEVEYTDEFSGWFVDLSEADQDAIDFTVDLLGTQAAEPTVPAFVGHKKLAARAHARAAGSK